MSSLIPPSADSVLYVIYKRDGDGATTYEVEGGMVVSYWYGQEFDFKGKHYFTGFGSMSSGDDGPDGQRYLADDPEKVGVSQATFERVEVNGKPTWKTVDTDGFLGEFGRNERPEELDETRKSQSYETKDGRFMLAVPTQDFVSGEAVKKFSIFVFDPELVNKLGFRKWRYLGAVRSGGNNSAACDEGKVMPCVSSAGEMSFGEEDKNGLPRLVIALKGTGISGPGKTRDLGAADAQTYHYDEKAEAYTD